MGKKLDGAVVVVTGASMHGYYLALPGPRMICMRASDLPAAAPHTASQHPISLSSIRPATCGSVERSEVPRCPPNGPTIDGKDGVAGSIPAGGSIYRLTRRNADCLSFPGFL
jgi:hypothetical protein